MTSVDGHLAVAAALSVLSLLPSCGGGAPTPNPTPVAERRCGESPNVFLPAHNLAQLSALADCTVLVGMIQLDSLRDLPDLAQLANVRKIEGYLNVFRSPGFVTLNGLDSLEVVEGNLFIHLNDNLTSIEALGKLRTVTGKLTITGNPKLPQGQVDALGARVAVGETKYLQP